MITPRHQLAVYSPISGRSVLAGLRPLLAPGSGVAALAEHLRHEYSAHAVAIVDSGTSALQLAIRSALARMGEDAIVALPGFSCYDIATAAVGANARVLTYDIDPDTLTPDEGSLRDALNAGARVIVVAPLYGLPVPWDQLERMAHEHGAIIIEDAAQGHGATWRGRVLGSLGPLSVLSFGRGKGWTGGGGGALLARDIGFSITIPSPRGLDLKAVLGIAAQWVLGRPSLYGIPRAVPGLSLGETIYHEPWNPGGMSDSTASALLANRGGAHEEAHRRRATASEMIGWLSDVRGISLIGIVPGSQGGYLRLPIRLPSEAARSSLVEHTAALGVAASYPRPIKDLPSMGRQMVARLPNPGAEVLSKVLATLPTHSLVSDRERRLIRANLSP